MTTRNSARRRGRAHGGKGGAESRATILWREHRVMELIIAGHSQGQIAKEIGISQPAVSRILKRLAQRRALEDKDAFHQHLLIAERKYEHLYKTAFDGYAGSLRERTRRRQRKQASGTGGVTSEIELKDSAGDPRYLEQARKAAEALERIQGVTAALRNGRPGLRVGAPNEAPNVNDVLQRLRRKLGDVAARRRELQPEESPISTTLLAADALPPPRETPPTG